MKFFAVLLIQILCCSRLVAFTNNFHQYGLQHITQENGLVNNTLYTIHQDKEGFMWLGTDVGISRYDGFHFHNYDLVDIEPQAIKRICEMSQDNLLWLQMERHNRMACFDKTNGQFITLESESEDFLNSIYDVCVVDSTLYVGTAKGIERLKYQQTDHSIRITPEVIAEHYVQITQLVSDENYLYALDTEGNILIYDYLTHKKRILNYARLQTDKKVRGIRAINGYLWILTKWNGTYCYLAKENALRSLNHSIKAQMDMPINDIAMKNDSTFIAATPNSIVKIKFSGMDYLRDSIEISEVSFDNLTYDSYAKNRITSLYIDQKNAIVWMTTFGKGLMKSNMMDAQITRINLDNRIYGVNGVVEDIQGNIWISTENHGIWVSDENKLTPSTRFSLWEQSTADGYYCIQKDNEGNIWIGDYKGTVQCVTPQTGEIKKFQPKYDGINSVGSIQHIYLSIHNEIWLTTQKGIFVYDHKNDKCIASKAYDDTVTRITSLCEDQDGIMWLGTNDGIRNAIVKGKEIQLRNGREQKAGISKTEVLCIYMNRYNQMYVAYKDKIVQTGANHDEVEDIKIIQKDLTSGHIECIIDDKNGSTWMGNNIGIIAINNKTKVTYTYQYPERFTSVCQLSDGRLLWANSTGLMYFDPTVLKEKSLIQKLHITDIGVNYNMVEIREEINGQVILEKPINQTDKLELAFSNNNIVFYLTDLSYKQIPTDVKYRLLPIQQEWSNCQKTQIEFTNLKPGEYTLEVYPVSINNEDVEITKLDFVVHKHWASSGWAILVYLLITGLIITLAHLYYQAKQHRRQFYIKKEERLKSKLNEEVTLRKEEAQNQYLRNQARHSMARELRSPLSMVIAPLKELSKDNMLPTSTMSKAKLAYRNALSMQNICNLMMDIYKQENEEMTLHVACYSIKDIINHAIAASNELLNAAPIQLRYDKDDKIKRDIWIDRNKIIYVLRNVISNAFRHIAYAGEVEVNISIETLEGKEYCCYQIKDNGKEMIEQSKKYILSQEGEEQELTTQLYAELGVIMMRKHITAHHGDIHIIQDKEIGNCVNVYIPMGKEHFEGDKNIVFIEKEIIEKEIIEKEIIEKEIIEKEIIEKENAAETHQLKTSNNGKHKILVIEDNKDIRLYLNALFSNEYHVIMAENGKEGVKMARQEMPDIILSDIMMPVMNGFESTRILKEDLKTCHIPIILLTALTGDENAVKGIELGADDYILKPFNADILRSKVKRLIENRQNLKTTYMKLMMASVAKEEDKEEEQEKGEDPLIQRIFEIIENNLQNPDFNVKRLAEMVNMSQPTLYRRVKMLTNYTIIELIRGVRLKNAAELLKKRIYSIQEVSEKVGYNDVPTFRKHFIEFYGSTPSAFIHKEEVTEKKMIG